MYGNRLILKKFINKIFKVYIIHTDLVNKNIKLSFTFL